MSYKGKSILCSICVRGGSKGVPNKNIRPLHGTPLLAHSIDHALATGIFDTISVSSDSEDILSTAKKHGADIVIRRPDEMANDVSPKLIAIEHVARETEKILDTHFDIFVDLDATSPLRLPSDIIGSVDLLLEKDAPNVITGCTAHRNPYFNLVEENADGSVQLAKAKEHSVTRRQDAPKCYDMNASIYVWKREALLDHPRLFYDRTQLFEMPAERSWDIDNELDFDIVSFLMEKQRALT